MKLTDAKVRAIYRQLQEARSEKTLRFNDGLGLYLEIRPANIRPCWMFKFRFPRDGVPVERRMSFGPYPEVSLKQAREKLIEARALVRDGFDPSVQRRQRKLHGGRPADAVTFRELALEWWGKQCPRWSESNQALVKRRLEADVFPWIGDRPVRELQPVEVLAVLRVIESRGVLETAARIRVIISQVCRYGVATGRCEKDLTEGMSQALTASPPKRHLAAITDPERLGEVLRLIWTYQGGPVVRAAMQLQALLFVRPGELRTMRWSDVDFPSQEWRLVLSKTHTDHIVPLADQVVSILQELHPMTGQGEYVFCSPYDPSKPLSNSAVRQALKRLGINEETTGHGFRATARTLLDEVLKFRPDHIEHQLGHRVRDPLGRAYNRTKHLVERKRMMQVWADYLDELRASDGG